MGAGTIPTEWQYRCFAGSWATIFAGGAWWAACLWPGSYLWVGPMLLSAASACGLVWPAAMQRPYACSEALFAPLGEFFFLLMLVLVYFGLFLLFALVLRLLRWDPLRLHARTGSAWVKRETAGTSDFYWQY